MPPSLHQPHEDGYMRLLSPIVFAMNLAAPLKRERPRAMEMEFNFDPSWCSFGSRCASIDISALNGCDTTRFQKLVRTYRLQLPSPAIVAPTFTFPDQSSEQESTVSTSQTLASSVGEDELEDDELDGQQREWNLARMKPGLIVSTYYAIPSPSDET